MCLEPLQMIRKAQIMTLDNLHLQLNPTTRRHVKSLGRIFLRVRYLYCELVHTDSSQYVSI